MQKCLRAERAWKKGIKEADNKKGRACKPPTFLEGERREAGPVEKHANRTVFRLDSQGLYREKRKNNTGINGCI